MNTDFDRAGICVHLCLSVVQLSYTASLGDSSSFNGVGVAKRG